MKEIIKWIVYIVLTFAIIRLIPFSQLSDFVAEKIPSEWVGEGEDAYNNIDMIAILIHIVISAFIYIFAINLLKLILKMFKK